MPAVPLFLYYSLLEVVAAWHVLNLTKHFQPTLVCVWKYAWRSSRDAQGFRVTHAETVLHGLGKVSVPYTHSRAACAWRLLAASAKRTELNTQAVLHALSTYNLVNIAELLRQRAIKTVYGSHSELWHLGHPHCSNAAYSSSRRYQ